MKQNDTSKNESSGAFVAVGVGVGSALGVLAGLVTGDWSWMPLALSAGIALGAVAAWRTTHGPGWPSGQ